MGATFPFIVMTAAAEPRGAARHPRMLRLRPARRLAPSAYAVIQAAVITTPKDASCSGHSRALRPGRLTACSDDVQRCHGRCSQPRGQRLRRRQPRTGRTGSRPGEPPCHHGGQGQAHAQAQRGRAAPPAATPRPSDRKEAAPRSTGTATARSAPAGCEAMQRGEEWALPPRDRGPVKALARDFVDSRRRVSEFYMYGLVFLLVPAVRAQHPAARHRSRCWSSARDPDHRWRKGCFIGYRIRAVARERCRARAPGASGCTRPCARSRSAACGSRSRGSRPATATSPGAGRPPARWRVKVTAWNTAISAAAA